MTRSPIELSWTAKKLDAPNSDLKKLNFWEEYTPLSAEMDVFGVSGPIFKRGRRGMKFIFKAWDHHHESLGPSPI